MGTVPQQTGAGPSRVVGIPAPAPGRSPRATWMRWAAAAPALMATAFAGWTHRRQAIRYETVLVERGAVQSKVTATGTLNAVVEVLVSSQVSGNIKALYADWWR